MNERKGFIEDYATGRLVRDRPEEESRQLIEKRLVEEKSYSKNQLEIEVMIWKGSKKIGPADLVVYRDDKGRSQNDIFMIVETKRPERTDGLEQLKTYLSPSRGAKYGIWFNGKEVAYLEVLDKHPYFKDVFDVPAKGETTIHLPLKRNLRPAIELKSVFEVCHNYIYANEGFLKEKTFLEVLKVIFIKMVDEQSASPKCKFGISTEEEEEIRRGEKSPFSDRITELFGVTKTKFKSVFDPKEEINLKPITLAFLVSQLQNFSLMETSADVKGTAFQTFVHEHLRGERGEFFTPAPIIDLAVKMLDPKDDEMLIDPACGSGKFLIEAMKHVWETIDTHRTDLDEGKRKDMKIGYARTYIRGIDINPDLAKICKMYMILYDDGHTGIFAADSLEQFEKTNEISLRAGAGELGSGSFKILLTNPPFGTKGRIENKTILRQYDLGHKWKYDKKQQKWVNTKQLCQGQVPDILFIERCLQLLCNRGRMAIVLPDGDLNNITLGYILEFINQNTRVLATVSLPRETFVPYGAGTKTSVLFLQKLKEDHLKRIQKENYPIFTAVCENMGYDIRGRTAFRKDKDGRYLNANGDPVKSREEAVIDTDIPEIIDKFNEFRRKHLDF